MRQEGPIRCGPLGPLDWFKTLPFEPAASSDRLGWAGLQAVRYRSAPASELSPPAMTHHRLILFTRPPEELDLLYEGVKRHVPPPAGSIVLVPAGTPARYRWSGRMDTLNVYLQPGLVARVAAETFGLDPARLTVPPLDASDLPHLRAAMWAVDAELSAGDAGGRLAAESLANVLAVHLIRHVLAPRRPPRGPDGVLSRARLRAVVEYVQEHLDGGLTLGQLAAVARLSLYHFARQFKRATGLPPHRYVITRRVERAKQLLQAGGDVSLARVAARAGFADQSQFSHHFKRLVGVTPGRFRASAATDPTAPGPLEFCSRCGLEVRRDEGRLCPKCDHREFAEAFPDRPWPAT
jgi:AraC family transcriptional regulator